MRSDTARALLKNSGLRIWQNKSLDQLTDEECIKCLKYIQSVTGTYYY